MTNVHLRHLSAEPVQYNAEEKNTNPTLVLNIIEQYV